MLRPVAARVALSTLALFLGVAPAYGQISGFVVDQTLAPIEGARVSVQAGGPSTTSVADGSFALPGATGADLVIVAAKKGFFSEAVTVDAPTTVTLEMALVPQDDDSAYEFVTPESCGTCHPDQLAQWSGSPMALAGTNTWVTDIYSGTGTPGGMGGFVYLRDSPFAVHNPESECSSCHQPEEWIKNPFTALIDLPSPPPEVAHGISCDVCHKIADIDESKLNFPGIYPGVVTFTRPQGPAFEQVMYGVLGDVSFSSPSVMRSSHQPQLVAEVCAACHQDKNDPDEDGDFEEPDGVISEPTYWEWAVSPFADPASPHYATCVDCHMPPTGATEACSVQFPPVVRDADTIRSHRLEGTTPYYLENAVELAVAPRLVGNALEVDVEITNSMTGHRVPTGVTVRNMILLIDAWRQEDGMALTSTGTQTVHDLGGLGDPAQGYYAGLPGKFFAKLNHDASGSGPTFFTDATGIIFDTRIPALATDLTNYTFTVPAGDGTLHVRARLIYRRAFRFLVDAKLWTEDGHGNPLEDVQPPYYGHLMEEEERVILAVSCDGQPMGTPCSDGNVCNGDETCDGAGNCQAGTSLDCDDGNPCTDDTCDWYGGCEHVANTAPCDDGDACTTGDVCSAEACVSGSALDCNDLNACTQDSCDQLAGCVSVDEPRTMCLSAARSSLDISDNGNDARDQIKWKWLKGEAVAYDDLGRPVNDAAYSLCVYDSSAGVSSLATRFDVATGLAWRNKAPRGWTYKDNTRASDGVQTVRLRAGNAGKTSVKFKAKGDNVPMPDASNPLQLFSADPEVVVQLVNDQTATCWSSTFSAGDIESNDAARFRANRR